MYFDWWPPALLEEGTVPVTAATTERIPFNSPATLKDLSILHTATALWQRPEVILTCVASFADHLSPAQAATKWTDAEQQVTNIIRQLQIPQQLAQLLVQVHSSVGQQMRKWCRDFGARLSGTQFGLFRFFTCTRWTARGRVCERGSVEALLDHPELVLDLEGRYRLACDYCCERHLPKLYAQLPIRLQKIYTSAVYYRQDRFWVIFTLLTTGQIAKLEKFIRVFDDEQICAHHPERPTSVYEYAFKWATMNCWATTHTYYVVAKHLCWKLNACELDNVVKWCQPAEREWSLSGDIGVALLSRLDNQQQNALFEAHSGDVVKRLSGHWLWLEWLEVAIRRADELHRLSLTKPRTTPIRIHFARVPVPTND